MKTESTEMIDEQKAEQLERRDFIMSAPGGLDFTTSKQDGRKFVFSDTEAHWKRWKADRAAMASRADGDGGHAAALCDEATCSLCEMHYPEIAAKARVQATGAPV